MSDPSNRDQGPEDAFEQAQWDELRDRVLGLGERSMRKSYYAGLQERLRELERFRTLVDAGADALFLIRCSDGSIVDSSRAAARLLARPLERLVGSSHRPFFDEEGAVELDEALGTTSSEPRTFDSALLPAEGQPIPVSVTVTRMDLADGAMALVVASDLRERLQAEAQRRLLERRALQGQRLESLGQLAGRIAHDFNNLIQVIFQHASLGQLELEAEHPVHEDLTQIIAAAQVARGLTREMTAYAGGGERRRSRLDLSQLASQMANLLKTAIARRARLEVQATENLPTIDADASQLRQVLLNLVVNSAEAAPTDRVIDIEVATSHVEDVEARSACAPGSTCVRHGMVETPCAALLTVRDTGSGITKETLEHIFDPFFTTKPEGKGFGLATVLGIIRGHKGAITVDSAQGEGTCIEVMLPCALHGQQDDACEICDLVD